MGKNRQVVLTEGPILKALIALALPDHGNVLFKYILQHYGHGVDWNAWFTCSGRCRCGRYVRAAVCTLFTDELIALFHVGDAETVRYAVVYTRITCGLVIFSYLTVVLTGIYTAQGDSKTPLVANFLGLFVNVVLDPLLILGVGPFPRLEVVGAAIATVLAQFIVMTVLVLGVIRDGKKNVLSECYLFRHSEKKYYQGIFRIGVPTALQSTAYCAISMVLTRMVADFGPAAVAVQRVGGQVEALSWNTADGFAASINAFSAQNYGAGKMDRIRKGYWIAFRTIAARGDGLFAVKER